MKRANHQPSNSLIGLHDSCFPINFGKSFRITTQLTFICSKSTIETKKFEVCSELAIETPNQNDVIDVFQIFHTFF